ncbi:MAG: hypothetical protein AAGA23_01025 [Pseudomonadota bacterium]
MATSALTRSQPLVASGTRRRGLLAFGAALVLTLGLITLPGERAAMEPALLNLMKFMAAIKAGTALLALALSGWRLGRPASPALLTALYAGPIGMTGAALTIWQLQYLLPAMAVFYGSLALLIWAAIVDSD